MNIKILKNEEALDLLNDPDFLSTWQQLSSNDEKVTVIQEPAFVQTWYSQYSNTHDPVVVVGFDESNRMIGLLPLAFARNDGYLTHAGDWQAEYHGWICEKNIEEDFLLQAAAAIKNAFNLRLWNWRWIPPRANINWLYSRQLRRHGIFIKTIRQNSPVLDLSDEGKFRKVMRNKSIRVKINRFKKRGNFYLERIRDREKAAELFDVLAVQCNFRQEAAHSDAPFELDANKKNFYIARMDYPQNNHFTVLWLNKKPIAFHFGACDKTTVYLGLTGYDPVESKNSPGTILLIKLIELLKSEGFLYFDLTPGADEYKDRLSNRRQLVVRPTFYFNAKDKFLADGISAARLTIKKVLVILGIEPDSVKQIAADLNDFRKRIQSGSFLDAIRQIANVLVTRGKYYLFKLNPDAIRQNESSKESSIYIQNYSDLLLFREKNLWLTRSDVLRSALEHFSREETLYTVVRNGNLVAFAWLTKLSQMSRKSELKKQLAVHLEGGDFFFYNFYFAPRAEKFSILHELIKKAKSQVSKEIYFLFDQRDMVNAPEELNLSLMAVVIHTKFLGTVFWKSR